MRSVARAKWKLVLKGICKLYRAIYTELEKDGASSSAKILVDAAYKVGRDFGETLKKDFQLGNNIDDVAFAMEIEHKLFGVEAVVAEKSERKIVYHCHDCAWKKYSKPKLRIDIGKQKRA